VPPDYLPMQLIALPVPRVGKCWICEEHQAVIVTADNSTRGYICLACTGDALQLERFVCHNFANYGIRHPMPNEIPFNRF
jgi:hypothetical protein